MHGTHASQQQCVTRCCQRGAGGHDIVDEQHPQVRTVGARPKRRALQPLGASVSGLSSAVGAVEQPPTRYTELDSDRPGEQLCLVVPTRAGASTAGGCPCDHVDFADSQTAHHQPRQLSGHLAAIAVLEAMNDLARHALERQRSHDARLADLGRCTGERETAAVTEGGAGLITTGAKGGEDHGAISTRSV